MSKSVKACPAHQYQPIKPQPDDKLLEKYDVIRRYCELPAPHPHQDHEFQGPEGLYLWHD